MDRRIGKILVVDDEVELKNILVEALTAQGYQATGFTAGEQAIAALRIEAFDVLLTDLMMPGIDGITLVREAVQIDPNLICIMMTGQGTIQTAVDAMKVGTFDYVLKPFRLQTMLPVLTRAMNTRHLRLENVQLREAVAIHELSETIAFTLDPQTVLSKLADGALTQSEADEVSILLPTADGKDLYVAAVRGEKRQRLLGERVPLEESISSWVARERMPLILNGEVSDERFVALWPRSDIRSAVSVPMQVANKLVGIINLNMTNRLRPFTLGQMKALTILAGTAAAALESASLYTKVQKAEEKYRLIFENAVEGIFQSTPGGRFLTVNPAMARILGYDSPDEVVQHISDISRQIYVHQEDRVRSTASECDQGFLRGFEFEAYRKDGERIWLSLNRRVVRDKEGIEIYREGSVEDITTRKLTEKAMEALAAEIETQRQRLDNMVSSVPGVVWEAWSVPDAANQRIDFVSDYVEAMLGYSVEEWLSTPNFWLSIVYPDDREETARLSAQAFKSAKGTTQQFRWVTKEGRALWVESNYVVIKDEENRPIGLRGVTTDISERKNAEEALRESEERYKGLINSAFDGVVIHGNGKIQHANLAYAAMYGYSLEEIIGRDVLDLTPPEFRDFVAAKIMQDVALYEIVGLKKDGSHINIEISGRTCIYKGQPARLAAVRDITKRKQAEEQLRRQLDFTAAMTSSLGEGLYALDRKGRVTFMNPAAEAALGWKQEELLGQNMHEAIHFQHADGTLNPKNECALLGVIRSGKSYKVESDVFTRKDGTILPVAYSSSPIVSNGRIEGAVLAFHDITERQQAEMALQKSEERYRDLVENAHDIIYSQDLEGNYTSMNEAGQLITGYTREEALKLNFAQTVAPEDLPKAREMLAKKLAGEQVTAYETEIIAKDGRRIAIEANTKLVMHDGVPVGIQGIARDITERKRMENALRESEEQLRQSQKMEAIGQLAGGVAHDFNNLLTAINGYSSLAMRRLGDDHPVKPHLKEIKKAGDRAANLTRQLLAFGRKQMLQPLDLSLNDVVTDMTKMLKRLIGEDIQLVTKLKPELHRIKADPGQIEQVLMNLIVNARDAMPTGGVLTIETANANLDDAYTSKHVDVTPGQFIMLAVSDTGTGMDPQTRVRIFEPFFTTKEKGKGTGLGLSTVYGIVKQSGGNVLVYSEEGKGTSFKVYLPQVEDGTKTPAISIVEPVMRGSEIVLLVEDEDMVRNLASELLQESGYQVLTANGGEEAIKLFNEHKQIDLLITDVIMPRMSGKEVADRLRKLHPETKVLFMSGYTDEAIVHHGIVDSHITFIQKPFSENALAKKVREVLDAENGMNKSREW